MSRKAGNIAIGGFVIGALILVFFFLIFISGGNPFRSSERVVMYFDSSVQGLQRGAPVKLKGVELGQVVDIRATLRPDNMSVVNMVTADLDFDRIGRDFDAGTDDLIDTVIDAGLRAQLNYQSLVTGLLYIDMDFYPGTSMTLPGLQDKYREFPTRQTEIQLIMEEVAQLDFQSLVADLRSVIESTDSLLASGKIESALDNFSSAVVALEQTAKSLEKTSQGIDAEVAAISTGLNDSLGRLDRVLDQAGESLPELNDQASSALAGMRETMESLDALVTTTEGTLSEDSRFVNQMTRAAEDISRASRALQELSELLERRPEALLRGR